jgi:cell division protein ZapB
LPAPFFCWKLETGNWKLPFMIDAEVQQLEERVQRLIAAFRQARLEQKRALQERDRLLALNAELRRRIEGIVDRVRSLESEPEHES